MGSGKFSRRTLSLSFVKSMHSLTFPFAFGTATIGAHQSVGVSTGRMISSSSVSSVLRGLFLSWEGVVCVVLILQKVGHFLVV